MIKSKILSHKHFFTSSEKEIAIYILNNFNEKTANLSITQLANKIHVSSAALTRFCQKIDMNGFKEFQYVLSEEVSASKNSNQSIELTEIITSLKETEKILNKEAISLVANKIWKTQNVYIYGEAFTHILAMTLSRKLNKINIPSRVYNVASDTGAILPKKDSVHIFISTSGRNPNILIGASKISMGKTKNQMIVSITASDFSNIEKYENVHIKGLSSDSGIGDPQELPTVGAHVIQFISDTLYKKIYKIDEKENDSIIFSLSSLRYK
ncbi:MurR/RpiR family transcriptional regulator [Mycoplasma marinum]|uniref:MurR/RpiR family transcriptional regulator n=1 Tax=Mycoplasma marinum TaxID=1937190 RepID=A0A4R0XQY2_9MOLU|nr:MurR/RpiR family transcriptional regulator [Mycoplasma marinum]TCG11295.1 hypothetical protein C4B24_02515 [Mycoplasma marinum]